MAICTSRWTCPGFMFVPHKPHPVGNEYHTILDVICGSLFGMEIVEGKEKPKEIGKYKYHEYGKTGRLILILFIPLFITGKFLILNSGFCVLLSVIALKKMGVFSDALIKKRRYWPRYLKGE